MITITFDVTAKYINTDGNIAFVEWSCNFADGEFVSDSSGETLLNSPVTQSATAEEIQAEIISTYGSEWWDNFNNHHIAIVAHNKSKASLVKL